MPTNEAKQDLITALRNRDLHDIADRAAVGEFSDFASPHATPLMLLDEILRQRGHEDLAERVRKGDFDHDE
jgi:hypothetical protein